MFKLVNIESDSIKLFLERHSTSSGVEYLSIYIFITESSAMATMVPLSPINNILKTL